MKNRPDKPHRQHGNQPTSGPPPIPVDNLLQQGYAHHSAGRLAEAEALYRQVLQLSPDNYTALHLLSVLACQVGQNAVALDLIDRAIQVNPSDPAAHFNRGNLLFALQRYQDAVESYDQTLRLDPQHPQAHNNRGSAQHALKQYQAAVDSYDNAIRIKPDYAEAYSSRANTLYALHQYQQAAESCDHAIRLRPDYAEAHYNRGNALQALQQYSEAIANYDHTIRLKPDCAEAFSNRGNALNRMQRHREAAESCDQAIRLKPDYADAHSNRGDALLAIKQYPEALESYNQAIRLNPDCNYLRGAQLYLRGFLCDWDDRELECSQLEAAIHRGEKVAIPFVTLPVYNSPATQRQAADIFVRDQVPAHATASPPRWPRHDKIRIGYFSSDYYSHAISFLIAEMLELHDRSRFEILGFSIGPDSVDTMRKRVSAAMDRFLEVRSMPDREIAQLSRELEVDIAVDLEGFTRNGRPGIFAERAAPVQVNYLGYPGTMAAGYIDFLIADPTLIPEPSRQHYSEKIVYLPDTYQPNDSKRPISTTPCTRFGEGLPESAFVYCCFNNLYKITPAIFDLWMRILAQVEGSVLWLLEENPWAPARLRQEAARRGISPDRLIFAKPIPVDEHLARQRLADLFLDTAPYNAHTTASDALWGGLPLLTRIGETFAGRVAASLLRAIDLPDLITTTEAEYGALAIALAHDPQRCQALRHRLQQNRLTTPLFDTPAFTRHLEAAYTAIYDRHHAGLAPDHIRIPAIHPPAPDPLPQKSHPLSLTKSPAPHLHCFHVWNRRIHRS